MKKNTAPPYDCRPDLRIEAYSRRKGGPSFVGDVREILAREYPDMGEFGIERVVDKGKMSHVFRVTPQDGSGRRYCKFPLYAGRHIKNLFREAGSLIVARRAGLDVPEVKVGREFAFINTAEMEGVPCGVVSSALGGEELREMGLALGRFCIGLAEAFAPMAGRCEPVRLGRRQCLEDAEHLPDVTDTFLEKAEIEVRKGALPPEVKVACLSEIFAYGARYRSAPPVMCDMDMNGGNIIVRPGQGPGVIDLGEMGWDRMERLCYFLDTNILHRTGGVYRAVGELASPLVTDDMRRDVATYRFCADVTRRPLTLHVAGRELAAVHKRLAPGG